MDQITLMPEMATQNEIRLAEHAAVIRALGKRVVHDVIEIGRRLVEAKALAGHGDWLPWLEREFGWKEMTALRFMRIHEMAGKSNIMLDLEVPITGLYLLAAPSTPAEVLDHAAERAEAGEKLSVADVKKMIADARAGDKEANEKQLAKLRDQHAREVKKLKDELSESLTEEDIMKVVQKAVAPLEKQIEIYEKKLAKQKEKRTPAQPTPFRNEFMDWTIAVRQLATLPACGLAVLAKRDKYQIAGLIEECDKAVKNLKLWQRELKS